MNKPADRIIMDVSRNKRLKITYVYIINFGYLQFHKLLFWIKLNYNKARARAQFKIWSLVVLLTYCFQGTISNLL